MITFSKKFLETLRKVGKKFYIHFFEKIFSEKMTLIEYLLVIFSALEMD